MAKNEVLIKIKIDASQAIKEINKLNNVIKDKSWWQFWK